MTNDTKTVRIEIPANPGSSIYITSSDSGQTIVTIEQSVESNNVIKVISSPSKTYEERQMDLDCDSHAVEKNTWSEEIKKRGFVYITETEDGQKVDTSQLVKPESLPRGIQDVHDAETNSSHETNQQSSISESPIVQDERNYVKNSCKMKSFSWLEEETDQATNHHGSFSSSPERSQLVETFSLLGEKDNVSEEKPFALKTKKSDKENCLESVRPRTRHWTLCETDQIRRVTRRMLQSRVELSPAFRSGMKLSPKSPAMRNNRKDVCRSPLLKDEPKISSPVSRVYFKKKLSDLNKILARPLFGQTDMCSLNKQRKTVISNITNISEAKKTSKIRETRSSPQKIKRRSDRFKNKPHEFDKRKSMFEAPKKISQIKSTQEIKRELNCASEKRNISDHHVELAKQSNKKFHINRRRKRKASKNLNYVLFRNRKVFVPNINIIKQLNLQCQVSLKPIRVVETTNQHLNYKSELVEKLYSKQGAKEEPRNGNEFDFYVHKLVTVLSSMKPARNYPRKPKKNSLKVVQKAPIVTGKDQDAFDVNALFDEVIQKWHCLDTSKNTSFSVEENQEPILESRAVSNVSSSAPAKTLPLDLKPCFVLIDEDSRAENILRARALRYLQCIPKLGDLPQDTSVQPALRPYLLPYAWELPLHIFEHLRKNKLIRGNSAARRLAAQCKVTSSMRL